MSDSNTVNTLIVPLQLNTMYIEASRTIMGAKADFSRLPWSNGKEDFNSSTPFLGESVLSPPFQDKNFVLASGIHLHWVLPKSHRTYPVSKTATGNKKNPPAAPNRWLIKSGSNHWIVESDYINEHSTIYNRNAVTVPSENLGKEGAQPFVYLGRQMTLAEWQNETLPTSSSKQYWSRFGKGPLTAFGYGEMSFNTFYPNCRSVFGFFDPMGTDSSTYEVFGWYSDSSDDIVQSAITDLTNLLTDANSDPHLLKKICNDNDSCPKWLSDLIIAAGQKGVKAQVNALKKAVKAAEIAAVAYKEAKEEENAGVSTKEAVAQAKEKATQATAKAVTAENALKIAVKAESKVAENAAIKAAAAKVELQSVKAQLAAGIITKAEAQEVETTALTAEQVSAAQNWLLLGHNKDKYKDLRAQLVGDIPSFTLNTLFDLLDESSKTNIQQEYYCYGIQQVLNWSFTAKSGSPTSSLYYSNIKVGNNDNTSPTFNEVAIGQTGTEALSSYLANELGGSDAKTTNEIEEHLNTLLLAGSVQNDLVDIDENLKESAHSQGFTAVDSGVIWRIRKMKDTSVEELSIAKKGTPSESTVSIHESEGDLLNQLNQAQETYQQGLDNLESLKAQLYADWCKYMNSCYPPLGAKLDFPDDDLIKEYVIWESDQLGRKESEVGKLTKSLTEKHCAATGPLAQALLSAYTTLQEKLEIVNQTLATEKKSYSFELSEVPAPRYYKPKDPVVLFAADTDDEIVMPTKEALEVSWTNSIGETTPIPNKNTLFCEISDLPTEIISTNVFESASTSWSPQILQWLTAFYPEANGSNIGSSSGEYLDSFITSNFSIEDGDFDLQALNNTTVSGALEYSGSTHVSAHTKKHMQDILRTFLLKQYPLVITPENFDTELLKIFDNSNYHKHDSTGKETIGYIACKAYQYLKDKLILTQSLGGFNQALIQQTNNIYLPVMDPLGFGSYQTFTNNIDQALSGKTYPSPNANDQFMPIRTGRLDISKLAFFDYFGVENKASVSNIYVAKSLQLKYAPGKAWLSPRLSQETRLNFRWLAAEYYGETNIEMNSHPATSPICGWLLPNYFDDSLMIYDSKGNGLGSFSFEDSSPSPTWSPFPAAKQVIEGPISSAITGINPHLLNVLTDIQNAETSTPNFLTNIGKAQNSISPEYYAGHDSMAILMGKPVAVVRAQISLETKGDFVSDQGWIPFQQQLHGGSPQTDAYEQVSFNIRLGENGQLNDGLIAFWEEKDLFINNEDSAKWVDNTTNTTNTTDLTLSSTPKKLTMLMDPHGIVHATSGILPVKTIRIPADQYTKVLKNIEVTFKISPVLTPATSLQLSLPQEHGYTWSWLEEKNSSGESSLSQTVFEAAWKVHLSNISATTPTAARVWTNLIESEWILPNEGINVVKPLESTIKSAMKAKTLTEEEIIAIESVIDTNKTYITSWKETPDLPLISMATFETAWVSHLSKVFAITPTADTVWTALLATNWIMPLVHNTSLFQVKKLDDTIKTAMISDSITSDDVTAIETVLNTNVTGITPYNPEAKFYKQQQLLEGWLKISSVDNH